MSSTGDPSRLGDLPLGYVTQAQLQKSTERITQTMQAQLKAFADELFSRFPAPVAQPSTSAGGQHSASHHSTTHEVQPGAMQPVPLPETPHPNRSKRNYGHAAQPLPTQPAKRASLGRHTLTFGDTTDSSHVPGRPGHRVAQTTLAGTTPKPPGDYNPVYQPVADAIGGNTPFADAIMEAPTEKFKMPTMEKYDGDKDPAEHIQDYHNTMIMMQAPEVTICRCFPVTLTGSAKLWWNSLEKKSIGSFEELSMRFVHHFLANANPKLPSSVLLQTKQESGESLRAYIKRFQAKRLEVDDQSNEIAMTALMTGLQPGDLSKSLSKMPVRSYERLMSKAHAYMNMEEAEAYKVAEAAASKPIAQTSSADHQDRRATPRSVSAQEPGQKNLAAPMER